MTRAVALHEPAMMKSVGNKVCLVLQELLREGANVHKNYRLGPSPESCIRVMLYWTQLKPCSCIEKLLGHYERVDTFLVVGNRAIGLLQPQQLLTLVTSKTVDVTNTDFLGESTMSYLLMMTRKNNCLSNVRLLLELGCTVRNHKQIAKALLRAGNGNNNGCFPSLGAHADNDWIFQTNRYFKYKQILSLLAAAGMNPQSVDKVEDAISIGVHTESDNISTRSVVDGRIRYVDACEYDMTALKQSPPMLLQFCRSTIRKHLTKTNQETNLLVVVPTLPLPKTILDYILYKPSWHQNIF